MKIQTFLIIFFPYFDYMVNENCHLLKL